MLINGQLGDSIPAIDRGLSYGDGLFETIRFEHGAAPLWSRHVHRMSEGCQRLRIPMPSEDLLLREAQQVIGNHPSCVLRITLTRGVGARGYAMPAVVMPTRIIAAFPTPSLDDAVYANGISLHLCRTTLADQPLLAGIKHLNRLEQILARDEWNDPDVGEGLVCDARGHVISATAANLFAVLDDDVITPSVDRCGVAGVARAAILDAFPGYRARELPLEECLRASELFLSSSVRGILPIRAVGGTEYAPGPVTRAMQQYWRELGFA